MRNVYPEAWEARHGRVLQPGQSRVKDRSRFDRVNAEGGTEFADWIVSDEIQQVIGEFGKAEYGEPLFVPVRSKSHSAPSTVISPVPAPRSENFTSVPSESRTSRT